VFDVVGRDLRFAGRALRRTPLLSMVAVLCIAVGSGAVTTVFSALNALVLRPLPGTVGAGRLVRVERTDPRAGGHVSMSAAYVDHVRARARLLGGVAAWSKVPLTVRQGAAMGTAVYGQYVTGGFFGVLGVRPALGRFFAPDEDRAGSAPVVVVSERFWRTQLGADSGAVGRDVRVNGRHFTLVGVAPMAFQGADAPIQTDAWVPLGTRATLEPTASALGDPGVAVLKLAARLRPGVGADAARRELQALTAAYLADAGEPAWLRAYDAVRVSPLTALPADARRTLAGFLALLLGAAAAVLLIASVNVAALLSARALARRREMAVRAALGAGRGRLAAQLLTEVLVLVGLGAAGGVALAVAATRALERLPMPAEVPIRLALAPDLRVLAFAVAVSLGTGVAVGLSPVRRALDRNLAAPLRDGAGGSSGRRTPLGSSLVAAQLALSLLLLVGGGLFLRALQRASHVAPGFDATGVAVAPLDPGSWGYDDARGRAFTRALAERLAGAPGVTAVSYATGLPLTLGSSGGDVQPGGPAPRGTAPAPGTSVPVQVLQVAPAYFGVLRIPLLAGRDVRPADDARAAPVAVVNRTLVERLWPGAASAEHALGRSFGFRGARVTVVGVARDAKHTSLGDPVPPLVYVPLAQHWESRQVLLVRTAADPRALAPVIQDAIHALDVEVPRPAVTTLEEATAVGLLPQRVAALVTASLGGVGLLLAAVGLYGTMAYAARRRLREVGIRLALGAQRGDVRRLLLGEAGRLTAAGLAAGLALAAAATRLLRGLLVGVDPLDGLTFAATSVLLVAVALAASWMPARRAAAADPMRVLRGS
jgi:predicted permease